MNRNKLMLHRSMLRSVLLAGLIALVSITTSCASRQPQLSASDDIQSLDDFENFEDAFTRAAQTSVVNNRGNAQYVGRGRDSNLIIYFDYDSAYLALDGRAALDSEIAAIVESLRDDTLIRVIGHTDERGTDEYNLALGQRRADTVARYMQTRGLPRNQIQAVSYGETVPLDSSSSEIAWAENRRVEIVY